MISPCVLPLRLINCSYSTPFTNSRGNPLAGPTGNHERPPAANKTTRTATPKHRMVVGRTYHLGVSICCLPSDFSHRGNQIGSRKIVSRPTKPVIICWWRRANIAPPAPLAATPNSHSVQAPSLVGTRPDSGHGWLHIKAITLRGCAGSRDRFLKQTVTRAWTSVQEEEARPLFPHAQAMRPPQWLTTPRQSVD